MMYLVQVRYGFMTYRMRCEWSDCVGLRWRGAVPVTSCALWRETSRRYTVP